MQDAQKKAGTERRMRGREAGSVWDTWKRKFKNMSLKQKMFTFYGILFLVPLVLISVVIYREVSRAMEEKIRYSAVQGYEQACSYLEYKIEQLIQRTDVVVTSRSLRETIGERESRTPDAQIQMRLRETLLQILQGAESTAQGIHMKLYVDDRYTLLSDGFYLHVISEADSSLWYGKKGDYKVYFVPSDYLEEAQRGAYVALVRDIASTDDYRRRIAVLRMDIERELLEEILQNATPTQNAVTYLVNRDNTVVLVSDTDKLEALGLDGELPEAFSYQNRNRGEESLQRQMLGTSAVYCMRQQIRNTDWEMITVIPQGDMTEGIARVQWMVALLLLLFGMLTVTGGAAIISWIVRRISRMNESFQQVKDGNLEVSLPNDTRDEIGVLYDNYNDMIAHTRGLVREKYELGLSLKSAELKALQSQINPHFLYNTLDMVNWLAYGGRTEDIHRAVVSLSKYYRLVLNRGEDTLTLGEELAHVRYYINIQKIRFPDKIVYEETVEESVKECVVPKIILQPLVENGILHGIREKKDKSGKIRITGGLQGGDVCLQVIDDGVGMSEEELAHVMDGSHSESGSGYGVRNVHARLRLMFGEAYGLTYESAAGEGTCVTVRIPFGKESAGNIHEGNRQKT
ncbi:MAG: sensor histidine kinase [Eubacteriales bacterium]|nr:sensor histidine kinase [Eubacteriales bacterium]